MTGLLELRTIKCCRTKSTTGLLKLRTIKCCRTKSMTGLLELRTIKVREVLPDEKHDRTSQFNILTLLKRFGHWCSESNDITFTILKWNSLRRG
ncbi:hypothetical protein RCL_jg1067.t1 [Rhizophagus clarus]|uniref:Uncharacterized protein n=1 Tax=Rhizophagus clarus TaxID=94130 RepID=A0A8H3MAB0_9GLOM|nr:hypothetical protein RCL_jg1067.t1 [Rhizophagus clarus]